MYIPTTFMSSQGSCISASVTSITGSGLITSGTFQSGSVLYQYYQFEVTDATVAGASAFTASLNILSGSTGQAKILIVAAGGSSGRREVTWCPNSFCYTNEYCGGAGAGGVVYYNNFPIQSGSYQIGIAPATVSTSNAYGNSGKNSYIRLTNNFIYPPFTSSYITAYGGGNGGTYGSYHQNSPSRDFYNTIYGGSGGSGGGMGSAINGAGGGDGSPGNPNGGLNGQVQGYKGGNSIYSNPGGSTGGGGAGSQGVDQYDSGGGNYQLFTQGGDGITYNLTGTPTVYASGGPGYGIAFKSGYYGRGGSPGTLSADGVNGYGGVVIIAYPICLSDSDNCKTYTIRGGAAGGTVTYIPCDTQITQSTTIDFGYTGSFCTYNIAGYPTSTGTVVLTQTGSCNNFIPIPPTITCSGAQVKTPLYLWNWATTSQCYPTPSSCQRQYYNSTTINYTDYQGNSVTQNFGGGFSGGSGQVCARDIPTPTISRGTITKSANVCAFYCSGSI